MQAQRFYSQHGEDCLLWKFFGEKSTGTFLDIGAFDGRFLSNTLSFEACGWSGVCVEPHPEYFRLCSMNRPKSVCIHAACNEPTNATTVSFFAEKLGLLSGLRPEEHENVAKAYGRLASEFSGFVEHKVNSFNLDFLLETYSPTPNVDFLSIDVEGTEIDVLKGISLRRYRPRLIVVEANTNDQDLALKSYLSSYHYTYSRKLGVNLFFAATQHDAYRLAQLSFECVVEPVWHPLGEKFTANTYRQRRTLKG